MARLKALGLRPEGPNNFQLSRAACGTCTPTRYLLLCAMLGFLQRKLIYHPFRAARIAIADAELPDGAIRDIVVTADDGIELHGWHFVAATTSSQESPARSASKGFDVAIHGIARIIRQRVPLVL